VAPLVQKPSPFVIAQHPGHPGPNRQRLFGLDAQIRHPRHLGSILARLPSNGPHLKGWGGHHHGTHTARAVVGTVWGVPIVHHTDECWRRGELNEIYHQAIVHPLGRDFAVRRVGAERSVYRLD
jgi:hypothetical protein